MFRLIEAFGHDDTVMVGGRTFPALCVVEDDDAGRYLITPGPRIPARVWANAHAMGVIALFVPGHGYLVTERFIEQRTEDAVSRELVAPEVGWFLTDQVLTYHEILMVGDRCNDAVVPKSEPFVHLHAHSEYSALDGLSKVSEMVEQATTQGQPAIAITDHAVNASHPELQLVATKAGIKPIFGIEANLTNDRFQRGDKEKKDSREILNAYYHLILWAKDDVGLRNIWAIGTEANREGFYGRPRMDWDTLARYHEGVMASTACLRGPLAHPIKSHEADCEEGFEQARLNLARLLEVFGDDLYIELHTNQLEEQLRVNPLLVKLAQQYSVPTIAASDSHYPCHDDYDTHQVWIKAQTNSDEMFAGNQDYSLAGVEEVRKSLSYLGDSIVQESIANTVSVADRCTARVAGEMSPPVFSKQGGAQRDMERLTDLCIEAWPKRLAYTTHPQAEYIERFQREMKLLTAKAFTGYYLMVADYVGWAKRSGILVGPGRGSGSGSLVAYLAGITEIDPIEANLMFERFLTEGRKGLPDFDIDFPTSKRDDLENYINQKYGADAVVRVGTHIRLRNKGVIRDLARTLKDEMDINYPDIDAICNIIDEAESTTAGMGLKWDELWAQQGEVLEPYKEKYPKLFKYAEALVGRLKSYGKHAAGVVISSEGSLVDKLPMRMADDQMVCEFDMNALEALGYPKFDFLTLRTLDTIQMAVDLTKERYDTVVNVYDWHEEYKESEVWREMSEHTLGIFQIETRAMTKITKQFQPQSIQDLADVITLVRPGPMRSGLTSTYFKRKNGQEPVTYPDPRLEGVLSKSYGCMLYQEDIMAVCTIVAGYTLEEADTVRKILGKKEVEKAEAEGRKFIPRCIKLGMEEDAATKLWEQIAEFSKYSFNRSHAYAYAMIGYWCGWPKVHYPIQFLCAAQSTVDKDRIPDFIHEARRMGYAILPPDINESGQGFVATDTAVRYGLDSIKGIGAAAVHAITIGQPYASWDDFRERKGLNADLGVMKTLASVGVFDRWFPNRHQIEVVLERELSKEDKRCVHKVDDAKGPNDLPCVFDWSSEPPLLSPRTGKPLKQKPIPKKCTVACRNYTPPEPGLPDVDPYTDKEIRERERELLGVYLSSTPFDTFDAKTLASLATADEVESGDDGRYKIAGVVTKVRKHNDRNGHAMGFIGLFARDGDLDVTVFKDAWKVYHDEIFVDRLVLAEIRKNPRGYTLVELYAL